MTPPLHHPPKTNHPTSTPIPTPSPKRKILAFHGVAQSGRVFSRRIATIATTLEPLGYDFVYLTAPCDIACTSYVVARQEDWEEGDLERSWWETDDEHGRHSGIEQAMKSWGNALREHGPFVGALGFSQGGCAAASLASMLHPSRRSHPLAQKYIPASHPPLEFLIMFSGNPYRFPSPETDWLFYPGAGTENKIVTPTLAFYGEKEWARDKSQRDRQLFFISRCTDVRVIGHPWKHTVPRTQEFADMVVEFVLGVEGRSKVVKAAL